MSNSDDVQKVYAAYFGRDFTGIENRIIEVLVGNNPDVVIVDELAIINTARHGKSRLAEAMLHCMVTPVVEDYRPRDYEPLPKPSKQKLYIKEPRRQSFRQSMRSVNRNR